MSESSKLAFEGSGFDFEFSVLWAPAVPVRLTDWRSGPTGELQGSIEVSTD